RLPAGGADEARPLFADPALWSASREPKPSDGVPSLAGAFGIALFVRQDRSRARGAPLRRSLPGLHRHRPALGSAARANGAELGHELALPPDCADGVGFRS